MCYARLDEIAAALEDLDIDVISFEAARANMALLGPLQDAPYRGGVGPGVYDVHSPRIPDTDDIEGLLQRALKAVGPSRLWVNPDCGLKTRRYDEVTPALGNMVAATRRLRLLLEP
jgi:5-methyltetrahydropteroyltriglutamate--homocysteine methyltransferase